MSERIRGSFDDALYKSTYTLLYFTYFKLTIFARSLFRLGWMSVDGGTCVLIKTSLYVPRDVKYRLGPSSTLLLVLFTQNIRDTRHVSTLLNFNDLELLVFKARQQHCMVVTFSFRFWVSKLDARTLH